MRRKIGKGRIVGCFEMWEERGILRASDLLQTIALTQLSKAAIFALMLFSTTNCFAQFINPYNAVVIGAGLGKGISDKFKEGKQKKIISNSISLVEVNGVMVSVLRVPQDKITSKAKSYIIEVQNRLDEYYKLYKGNERINIRRYDSRYDYNISTIKSLDRNWRTEFYEEELNAYLEYESKLVAKEKRISDSIQVIRKKQEDSLAFVERVQGYVFVNKEFTFLKEKPSTSSRTIGKIYLGSYLNVIGFGENSSFLKVSLEDIEGYVNKADIVDHIDHIQASNSELAVFKSRKYYKYEQRDNYVPTQQNYGSSATGGGDHSNKSRSARKQSYQSYRQYIRGPRGGCYYMSGSSKVYVDRGYCR